MAGIEPATDGLRNRCSATELHWLKTIVNKAFTLLFPSGFQAFAYSICIWCSFGYENDITITDQAQGRYGLSQNTQSQPSSAANLATIILCVSGAMAS
jgi:hypothetical protein